MIATTVISGLSWQAAIFVDFNSPLKYCIATAVEMIGCKLVHGELHNWLDDSQFACSVFSSKMKDIQLVIQQESISYILLVLVKNMRRVVA